MRARGIRGLDVGGRARVLAGAAGVLLVLGCRSPFTGPYPCKPGFASCVDPSRNLCETDTTADGLHCGACGAACGVGAPCASSHCGQAAARLATLTADAQTQLETNATAVFWHGTNSIFTLPLAAGANATPTELAKNEFISCNGNGRAFGVDDANLYYWSNGFGCGASNSCAGLTQLSLADGTRTVLVPQPSSGGPNFCGSFAVGATSVYLLTGNQMGNAVTYTIASAQIGVAGQTLTTLGTAQSYNGAAQSPLALNSTTLFFEISGANNAPSFEMLPLAGGAMAALPIDVNTYGFQVPFAVDDANVYAVAGGCTCNNNGNGNNNAGDGVPPAGSVVKLPLDGRPATTLAAFSGEIGGVAVDATSVYWSTDTNAWKVPLAGGAAQPVAGNLSSGVAAFKCVTCGGGGQTQPSAIAVAASGVYIAVTGPGENALLEVAK